jgi:hypothetical protein
MATDVYAVSSLLVSDIFIVRLCSYFPCLCYPRLECTVNYRQYVQFRSSKGVTVVTNLTSCIRYKFHYCSLPVKSVCVKSPICNVPPVKLCTCFERNLLECTLDAQLNKVRNVFPYSRNLTLDTVLSHIQGVPGRMCQTSGGCSLC